MGGGNLGPEVSEVQVNPTIQIKTSLGANPEILTREDLSRSLTISGYSLDDITYLVQFGDGVSRVGSNFVSDLKIDICSTYATDGKLTSIFRGPDELIDICYSAFKGMSLKGGLDFSGFSSLVKIGAEAFMDNSLNDRVTFSAVNSLELIEYSSFKNAGISGPLEISGLPLLVDIEAEAFANNQITSLTLKDLNSLERIGSGSTGGKVFYGNQIDSITLDNLSILNEICGEEVFGNNPLRGSIRLKNISLVYTDGICYENFQDDLEFNNVTTGENFQLPSFADLSFTRDLIIKNTDFTDISQGTFLNTKFSKLTLTGNNDLSFIGENAFSYANFVRGIQISDNSNLSSIGRSAFQNSNINGGLDFSGLTSLTTIDDLAFATAISGDNFSLDFSTNNSLQRIGKSAFITTGPSNGFTGINFTNCISLQTIDASAFSTESTSNKTTSLDLSGLSSLETIGAKAFSGHKFEGLVVENCPDLSNIGVDAFKSIGICGGDLIFSNVPKLTSFPTNAFDQISNTEGFDGSLVLTGTGFTELGGFSNGRFAGSLQINENTDLSIINQSAFYGNNFSSFELTNNDNLRIIDASAFHLNNFENGVNLSDLSNLIHIREEAFRKSIDNGPIVLSNLPSLVDISNRCFADNKCNNTLTIENCPALQTLYEFSFYNSGISGDVTISGLDSLETIQNNAFGTTFSFSADRIKSVKFVNCPQLKGDSSNFGVLCNNFPFGTEDLELNNLPSFNDTFLQNLKNRLALAPQHVAAPTSSNFTGSLTLKKLPLVTSIEDFSGFASKFEGNLIINDCSGLFNIGHSAFKDCSFTSLELTDNSGLASIDPNAFEGNKFSKIDLKNNRFLTTIGNNSFADISNPNGTSLDLTGLTGLTSIGEQAFFNSGISGVVDFSGLSSLTDISSQAFDGIQNITQFRFFDNSGLNIGQNVYPGLSGDYSVCPIVDLSLQWLDAGFTITNSAEHVWNI